MKNKGRKGKVGGPSIYEESLKIAVARDYLSGQMSMSEVAAKYELPGKATVHSFVEWYQQLQAATHPVSPKVTPLSEPSDELKDAQLRIMALEMLIKNAEKEFGINIVKKFGTKQPPK